LNIKLRLSRLSQKSKLFRLNIRLRLRALTLFFMVAWSQRLHGIASRQLDGKHILMWDLENCTLQQAKERLRRSQERHHLSHIYIVSDKSGSYRAWCYSRVSLSTLIAVLSESLDILDYSFLYYTVKRREATLRTDKKKGRPEQKLIGVLESYPCPEPSFMREVVYDTG